MKLDEKYNVSNRTKFYFASHTSCYVNTKRYLKEKSVNFVRLSQRHTHAKEIDLSLSHHSLFIFQL